MGDELSDTRTQVLEQAMVIDELKQTAAEAEESRSKLHVELLGKMERLLKRSEAQVDPGGQLQQERRSTIEVHPKFSEAPHLRSSIPHPKTEFSKNEMHRGE